MNEAIKKWRQEPQEAKTVQKSDILEYLESSYYFQVRNEFQINSFFTVFRFITCKISILKTTFVCKFQGDLKKALYYINKLLELVPDQPRAVGNKRYYEETLAAEGKLDEELELSKRKGGLF